MPAITVHKNPPATPKQKKILRIVGLLFLATSPLWFLGAGSLYQDAKEKESTWTRTEGTVVRLIAESSSGRKGRSSTVYYPLFRYEAADGQSYEVQSNHGSSPPAYERGEKVTVLYAPEAPQEAVLDSFGALYLAPLVLSILGFGEFLMGAFLSYAGRKKEPQPEAEA